MQTMKITEKLALITFCVVAATSAQGAEYLFRDQAGSLYFRCGGVNNLSRAKVHYQGYGYYDAEGPYKTMVLKAENALEAAVKSCGEEGATGTAVMLGLKTYKDD